MTQETINGVMEKLASDAKKIYGDSLTKVILYGSCARGDFEPDSDIDVMLLLNVDNEQIQTEREKLEPVSRMLDREYDVILSTVVESQHTYEYYMDASGFFQNIEREGIRII